MGWSLTRVWPLKVRRAVLAAEGPPEDRRVPGPHQAPRPRAPVSGREVPITLAVKTIRDCGRAGLRALKSQVLLPVGPRTDLLGDRLARSELRQWGSSSKGSRVAQGGTEVSGCRVRAGGGEGAAFSQTDVQEEATVPSLSPTPNSMQKQVAAILSLHQPGYHRLPCPVIP